MYDSIIISSKQNHPKNAAKALKYRFSYNGTLRRTLYLRGIIIYSTFSLLWDIIIFLRRMIEWHYNYLNLLMSSVCDIMGPVVLIIKEKSNELTHFSEIFQFYVWQYKGFVCMKSMS